MSRKSDRLSDYKKVETTDEKGKTHTEVIYTGDYYIASLSEDVMNKYRLLCWIFAFVIFAVYVCMGLINNSGSRVFYVVLPYVCAYLPVGYIFSGCWYITVSGIKMTKNQYNKSVKRLKKCTVAVGIISVMTITGDIIYTVINEKSIDSEKELLYIIFGLISFIICFGFLKMQSKISFACKNQNKI